MHLQLPPIQGKLDAPLATQSSILGWKISWTEEPGRLQSMRLQRVDTTEGLHFHFKAYDKP